MGPGSCVRFNPTRSRRLNSLNGTDARFFGAILAHSDQVETTMPEPRHPGSNADRFREAASKFTAIQCRSGDVRYYICPMTYGGVAAQVSSADEPAGVACALSLSHEPASSEPIPSCSIATMHRHP